MSKADLVVKLKSNGYDTSQLESTPQKESSLTQNISKNVKQAGGDFLAGSVRGAGSIGATILSPIDALARTLNQGKPVSIGGYDIAGQDRRSGMDEGLKAMGADPNSIMFKAGKLGAEVAGTAGAGGALAKGVTALAPNVASKVPVLIDALRTSGMTAGGATGASGMASRVAGGAIGGAAQAGMTNPEDMATGAVIGGVMPPAVQLAGKVGSIVGNKLADRLVEQTKEFNRISPKNETIKNSLAVGYIIPPNIVNPSLKNQTIESISGKQATQQLASVENAKVTDKLARQALGIADDAPLTKEAMQSYRSAQHAAGYEPIRNLGAVKADSQFNQALDNISNKYTGKGTIPAVQRDDIKKLVDSHKSAEFDSGDAVDAMRLLRESADEAFRKGDTSIGKAYKDISKAYEDVIERNLQKTGNVELLQGFKDARQNMAKSFTVENAIVEGSGGINPQKIAAELQKGKPLSNELKTIAEFANTFKTVAKPIEQVGSPASHNLKSMAALLTGSGGYAALGPAGAAAATIPFIAPAMARSAMFRKGAQEALIKKAPQSGNAAKLAELLSNKQAQQVLLKSSPVIAASQ
ncbi:MAG: hypothetical protein PHT07_20735 [Paludibacter sp.]|nr:hypothetical protein [Paludibacter sp.]